MRGPKKKVPQGDQSSWVRTGGAVGDKSMEELDDYNRNGADVDEKCTDVDADINRDLPVKRINPSEA